MIQAAAALIWASMVASMIQAAAAPIWTSAISPFPLRLPQRPPRRFVSSSLTTEISLLSLSDKAAVDVVWGIETLTTLLLGHFFIVFLSLKLLNKFLFGLSDLASLIL